MCDCDVLPVNDSGIEPDLDGLGGIARISPARAEAELIDNLLVDAPAIEILVIKTSGRGDILLGEDKLLPFPIVVVAIGADGAGDRHGLVGKLLREHKEPFTGSLCLGGEGGAAQGDFLGSNTGLGIPDIAFGLDPLAILSE